MVKFCFISMSFITSLYSFDDIDRHFKHEHELRERELHKELVQYKKNNISNILSIFSKKLLSYKNEQENLVESEGLISQINSFHTLLENLLREDNKLDQVDSDFLSDLLVKTQNLDFNNESELNAFLNSNSSLALIPKPQRKSNGFKKNCCHKILGGTACILFTSIISVFLICGLSEFCKS